MVERQVNDPWSKPALESPPAMTPLVGRTQDLEWIVQHIVERKTRLLTLTGPGGVGKTRLAVAALEQCQSHFEGRITFVSLVAVADPSLVLSEIARVVARQSGGTAPPLESIARAIGEAPALLAIDNFEQVMPAAGDILLLLKEIPHLQLLVTSREALRLRSERVRHVPPLTFAGSFHPVSGAALSEAGRLFVASAKSNNVTFAYSDADVETINTICERLDGLPLAIELAAARTRILPPIDLLARLDEPLRLLVRGPRDLPERQQTMRNAIAWSFELLDPAERELFGLLSVFPGGISLTAVEEIWPGWSMEVSASSAFDLLESLIAKSLVSITAGNESRYSMLTTLREFGNDFLVSEGRIAEARELQAKWLLALGDASIPELNGGNRSFWLDTLERELANFRAAMEWVLSKQDQDFGLRLIEALWRFWETRGHMSEGEAFSTRVLASPTGETPPLVRAAAMYGASMMPYRLGKYEIAWERAEVCLAIARSIDDPDLIARGLNGCALIAFERGDFERSERAHLESLERSEQLGMHYRVSTTCVNLGILYYEEGRYDDAWRIYERAFHINASADRDYDRAFALNGLGIVSHRRGDLQLAQEKLNAAIEIRRADRDSGALAASLTNLAMVKIDAGDLQDATALLKESLQMRWSREELRGLNEALAGLARVAAIVGRSEESAPLLGTCDLLVQRGHRLPRPVAAELDSTRLAVRQALGEAKFVSLLAAGRSRRLQETVESALLLEPERPSAATLPPQETSSSHPLLSPRELDVLLLIAEGQSDRQIAETLGISRNTVIRHVANIFLKLDINSRTVAAMYAFNQGLVSRKP